MTLHADGGVSFVDDGRGIPVDPSRGRGPAAGCRGRPDDAPRRRQVRRRWVPRLRRPPRRRRQGRQRAVRAAHRRGGARRVPVGGRSTRGARRRASSGRASRPSATGTAVTFWADPEIFVEGIEYKREILAERLQELSFLTRGVEIVLIDEREDQPVKEVFKAAGGLADFVKHLAVGKEVLHTKPIHWSASRRRPRSRSPSSGTTASMSSCTRSPTRSTPTRAGCTRRA